MLKPKDPFEKKYRCIWIKEPSGEVKSYRLEKEELKERLESILSSGAVQIQDPFRKGAPVGGFTNNTIYF